MNRSAVALVCLAFASSTVATPPPNVIILLTDDQGYGDLSVHGNPVLKTPNLDRLHAESLRLTDFHVAPMCTPTRGQLMTGMDAVRNGATSVTAGRAFLRPGLRTMADYFVAGEYKTGLFGKWHLGDCWPHRPMDRGFQTTLYHKGWGFSSAPEFSNTLFDGRCFRNGVEEKFAGHCTDVWFDQAIVWMKERKEKGEPFFCYIPTNAPHAPLVVAEKYSKPYEGKGPAAFFGMIAQIDENLGKLDAFLREAGIRENTILIYMSDNGGTAGVKTFNAGMRGHKTEYYEGGHRVPCFIRWPAGGLRPAGDIDTPCQIQDVLPTLIDMCALKRPAVDDFDGHTLAGILRSSNEQLPDRMMVVQYGQQVKKWDSCVIWNKWRLVKGAELYDISSDPGQTKDVSAANAEVANKMKAHYEKWWTRLEPKVNDFVAVGLGSEKENPVQLTSSDWEGIYSDNSNHVNNAVGGPRGGHWNVDVETEGEYEIALRRWAKETDLPLGAKAIPASKVIAAHGARAKIAGFDLTSTCLPTDKEAVVRVKLPKGKTTLQAWFLDDEGKELCGAFYAYVRKL